MGFGPDSEREENFILGRSGLVGGETAVLFLCFLRPRERSFVFGKD